MVLEKIAVLKELTIFSVLLRTVLAMVFSGILGYEREQKGRPAVSHRPQNSGQIVIQKRKRKPGRISDVYGCLYRLGNCDDDGNFSEPGAWKH